jgi:hypothetical protein
VLPPTLQNGVFACHVRNGAEETSTFLINRPQVWWALGDRGKTATIGGWVRVFGKCLVLGGRSKIRLTPAQGKPVLLMASADNDYALSAALPKTMTPGAYKLAVNNGAGGGGVWSDEASIEIDRPETPKTDVYDVMSYYGADEQNEISRTLDKGATPVDRTDAINAALKKAQSNGGGTVYFPEGEYTYRGTLNVPANTTLKGEGEGLATLWWGSGKLAMDGGASGPQRVDDANLIPGVLVACDDNAGISDMTLLLPLGEQHGIVTQSGFTMQRVRIRTDRFWTATSTRPDGQTIRLGSNFQITDCDILAKGDAIDFGQYGIVARNNIMAGKCQLGLGGSESVAVEDNHLVSLYPTAYINVAGTGRNIYFARNTFSSLYAQQSDFSFTFDGTGSAYLGHVAHVDGDYVTLSADPIYPSWANETSGLWERSAVCVLAGTGVGQYRFVTANTGRAWTVDRPWSIVPDQTSVVAIVPFRGRLLAIGNRFEDCGWVNMGYGSSFDVICDGNSLYRCGSLLNYGLCYSQQEGTIQPSWYVQYVNNEIHEGHTLSCQVGGKPIDGVFDGVVTRAAIHRGDHYFPDNSGHAQIGGEATDVVYDQCRFENPSNYFDISDGTSGVLCRDNTFAGSPKGKYTGGGVAKALILPAATQTGAE